MTDPINELDGLIGRVRHGEMHQFTFSRRGDFTGAQAEEIVRRYGIDVWRREADNEDAGFSVKESQADFAEYLLLRAGVPLTSRLFNPANAVYAQRHEKGSLPTPWGAPVAARGAIGLVLNVLDGNVSLGTLAMGGLPILGLLGLLFRSGKQRRRRRRGTTNARHGRGRKKPVVHGVFGISPPQGIFQHFR